MVASVFKNNRRFLGIIWIIAFLVRASVFYFYLGNHERYWQVDSLTYHVTAQEIALGKGVSKPNGTPQFYRVPGYSFFLATLYKLFGINTKNVLWAQVIAGSFVPWLLFFTSLTLFPKNFLLAYACSIYSVFHLGLVLYSGFFMTETLFIIFMLLFGLFFFPSFRLFPRSSKIKSKDHVQDPYDIPLIPAELSSSQEFVMFYERYHGGITYNNASGYVNNQSNDALTSLLFSGIFLGFASLIRPVGHYLIVLSLVLLWFADDVWQDTCAKNFALVWGWLIVVGGWLLRNWMLTGYLFFHTLPGGHFLYLSAARVAMHVHDTSYQEARTIVAQEAHELMQSKQKQLGRPLQEIEECHVMERLALSYFYQKPLIALKNWCTDMFRTMFSLYSAELLYLESERQPVDYFAKGRGIWSMVIKYLVPQTDQLWLKLIIYGEIALYLFILIGFLGCLLTSYLSQNIILYDALGKTLPFMILFIVIALSGGYARMRLPLEPWLIIISLWFWVTIANKMNVWRKV